MADKPSVILTGFADEAANQKTVQQQFSAFAAIGLQYYSIRFIDVGGGIKNVMKLTKLEVRKVLKLQDEYGLKVSSLGSPIGKVKLLDVDDGTHNQYIPFASYLARDVDRACQLAVTLGTRLLRGFSFYHPRGTDAWEHIPQVVDQLGEIADRCQQDGLIFGLEVEANLVGQDGALLAELYRQVNHPSLMLIFDAGNIVTQGFTADGTFGEYLKMKSGIGWMHIKDYRHPQAIQRLGHVDEASLKHFVPPDIGDSGHEAILRDFRDSIPRLERKLKKMGVPGVFLDLEPHVKGGGQFGGFSGPDGMGVTLRGLCNLLDYLDIGYHIRDFDDIIEARGF